MDAPSADQINSAISATDAAVKAVKSAWEHWETILPWVFFAITQAMAWVKGLHNIPGLSQVLNLVAGNYRHAKNQG